VTQYGKSIRLRRILHPDRGSLVVAFDHPLVLGPIPGTINPGRQIARFIEGKADAVLLNLGMMRHVAEAAPRENLPGLIARLDWTTALGTASQISNAAFRSCLVARPEEALRHGADAVIVFLVVGSGDADFDKSEIQRVARVSRECEQLGLPLVVESLARGAAVHNPQDPEWLLLHTRIAAELGADVIKTEYTGDPETMRRVIDSCPIPVLVLGGSRSGTDHDVLNVVRSIMRAGAAGVFFGRNVFQAKNIPGLMERIHLVLRAPAGKRGR
jgi:fructose-bisphosphate aldolase/2-amino-3,7-dideoxy-D-threo-hept-6-ulosonate synthase